MDAGLGGSVSDWELKEETVTARQWVRSWRQEFYTDYGEVFRMVAHMERITLLPNGTYMREQLPCIERTMHDVAGVDGVLKLQAIMTDLINTWRLEDKAKLSDNAAHGGVING